MIKQWMIVSMCCVGMVSANPAKADVLTLSAALQEARMNNSEMKEAQALIRAAQGERISASRPANPELEVELGGWDDDFGDEDVPSIEIRQPMAPIGTRHLQRGMARNQVDIQALNARRVWARVYADVRTAYSQAALFKKQAELLQDNMTSLKRFMALIEDRYQSGEIPKSDFQRGQIEAFKVESDYLAIENERRKSLARLNLLLGRAPEAELDVEDVLKEESLTSTLKELTESALAQNPDLRISVLELDSARKNLLKEKRSRWPSWSLGLQRTEEADEEDYAVLLGVNIPLWDFNSGDVRKAEAERDMQTVHEESARKETTANVFFAFLDAETAFKRMSVAATSWKGSQDFLQLAHERYSSGSIDFMDYRDQIRTAAAAGSAYYQSLFEMSSALNELETIIHASLRQEEVFNEKF